MVGREKSPTSAKTSTRQMTLPRIGLVLLAIMILILGISIGLYLADRAAPASPVTRPAGVVMFVPAVDLDGNGVIGVLHTDVVRGSGQVFVNINITTLGMTQESARTAVRAAAAATRSDMRNVDVTFTIDINATAIEGPSAGAAMAVSVVYALRNETPRSDVMITGTINENGLIGAVGSVREKARAARDAGAALFLVPPDQNTVTTTVRERNCQNDVCTITYRTTEQPLSEVVGIDVRAVATLDEAVRAFGGREA